MRSEREIGELARTMLTELLPVQKSIRLLGVTLSNMSDRTQPDEDQLSLLS